MDLTIQEQQLLADFRRLPTQAQRELMEQLAILQRRHQAGEESPQDQPANQCRLAGQPEKRPEAAKEPIFTE
ncbi:MAG: hypothetical protein GJT30_09630 [Geobacter sp.]|nr:hypothetical protein [Geobacter sp.]